MRPTVNDATAPPGAPATLDSQRWERLSPRLDELLELDAPARAERLAAWRTGDPALAADLDELLRDVQAAEAEAFLEDDLRATLEPPGLGAGMVCGAWTLERPLGTGGMGSVWLAQRSDGRYHAQAAIKLPHPAVLVRGGAERFEREGRLLARVSHPHIAGLLDAGVAASGQPYLVLEYVQGEPIDAYCDRRRASVGERVALFLDVLAAVAHAHTQLVLHRDLKPSNILVDASGRVKLLDFGVAKLIEGDTPGANDASSTVRAFTPDHVAPEQLQNGPVGTATDVYALGVLFYGLLAGRHPTARPGDTPVERLRAVVETMPPRMSDTAATAGAANSLQRAATPKQLARALRGDLDTIVAKALKKSAAERYAGAAAFADDLRRWRDGEPVLARPDSFTYVAAKFVRRHRLSIAAAALLAVGLAAAMFAINRERLIAERRFDQLRTLSEKVFELDRSIVGLPGSTQARQRLVTASLSYLEGLAKNVHGDLDLMLALGEGYWRVARIQGVPADPNLGEYEKAERNLAIAQGYVEAVHTARPDDHRIRFLAAMISHDRMILADGDRRNDQVAHARKAAMFADRFLSAGPADQKQIIDILHASNNVALAYTNLSQYEEAVRILRRLLETNPPGSGRLPDPYRSNVLSILANALRLQGNLPEALAVIREAREKAERAAFPSEITRMMLRYAILLREGMILRDVAEFDPAARVDPTAPFQAALDITEAGAVRDPTDSASRSRLARVSRELGDLLKDRDPGRALAIYDHALKRVGETPKTTKMQRVRAELLAKSAYPLRKLARATEAQQRLGTARAILEEIKDFPAETIALGSPQFAVLSAQADDDAAAGRIAEAATIYETILAKAKYETPWAAPENDLRSARRLARILRTLTSLHVRAGSEAAADQVRRQYRELVRVWEKKLPGKPIIGAED